MSPSLSAEQPTKNFGLPISQGRHHPTRLGFTHVGRIGRSGPDVLLSTERHGRIAPQASPTTRHSMCLGLDSPEHIEVMSRLPRSACATPPDSHHDRLPRPIYLDHSKDE
jgi:hypothetical protein